MHPFRILGLDRGADEATIKRAYARLLRTHRPEDDAAAFQRLHDAYVACIDAVRSGMQDGASPFELYDDEDTGVALAPQGAIEIAMADPTRATADAGFEVDAFFDEFLHVGRMPQVDIASWLRRHPDLEAFDHKAMVADALVWRLLDAPPLPSRVLAATLHHFELDIVTARYRRMEGAIEELRHEAVAADGDPDNVFVADREVTRERVRDQRSWWWLIWIVFLLAHGARALFEQ
jgi:hypothetical protein